MAQRVAGRGGRRVQWTGVQPEIEPPV